ncbi:hypothetical protein PR202_gb27270 [Eleusine coracana subsp. coracana]|uniref:PB1 domain-containing protein n=1 Tax=Eleusine coracana subsp. coracana TaxID=191504 RepID=A0AAV5FTF4_ELECO|nr:hypothetical protein PR202_gb27270 [Eleusine coracana subsp. coracana]
MDLDPSPSSAPGGDACGSGDAWPFDTLTTSLLFSSVSASPSLPPLPANSSSWLTPPSPLWLFDDRQLLPLEAPAAPEAAVAAAVVEEVQRVRSDSRPDGIFLLPFQSWNLAVIPDADKYSTPAVNLKSTEILDHPNVQICNEGRQTALVEILEILTVVVSDRDLSGASLQLSNVLKIENEEFKKDVQIDNSEGCLRESPDGDTRGRVHEFDTENKRASNMPEGHMLADDYSQENGTSATRLNGPLPIPVGPSSDSLNVEKVNQSKVAELSNPAVDGDRDSSLQKSFENDCHFGVLITQQGLMDNNNNAQLEADKASHSRSSSGEGSINSRTSEGSCQGSPANQTFVCKPIASTFAEPQINPEEFTKEPFQEPQLPLSRMLIEDSGSSKDLKNLFTSTSEQPFFAPPSNLMSMKHSGTVTIKASFKEDIVRFRFPCSGSVTVLKDEVAKRLRMDVGMFDIKYLDDDHEWVKLACNADLEECMEISRHSGSHVIRLLVSDIAAHLGSSCGSSG